MYTKIAIIFRSQSDHALQSFGCHSFFSNQKRNFRWSFFLAKKKIEWQPKGFPFLFGLKNAAHPKINSFFL